jgi:hypothetical protein
MRLTLYSKAGYVCDQIILLSALVLDGTLEQLLRLRGGVIELGALWVPLCLKILVERADPLRGSPC